MAKRKEVKPNYAAGAKALLEIVLDRGAPADARVSAAAELLRWVEHGILPQ